MCLDVLVNVSLQTVVSACAEMRDAWSGAKLVKREAVSRSWPDVQRNALLDFLSWGNVFFTPSDAALFQWMNEMNVGRVWLRQLETCFLFIWKKKISNTKKLGIFELQVRIELTTLRVLVWMLFPEPKKRLDRKNSASAVRPPVENQICFIKVYNVSPQMRSLCLSPIITWNRNYSKQT